MVVGQGRLRGFLHSPLGRKCGGFPVRTSFDKYWVAVRQGFALPLSCFRACAASLTARKRP